MLDIRTGGSDWRYGKKDIKPSASLKKALFCDPNPQRTREDIDNMMREIKEADKKKYNFDFENERPLPGPYNWERDFADMFEAIKQAIDVVQPTEPTDTTSSNSKSSTPSSQHCATSAAPVSQKPPSTPSRRLDDYFPKRKRASPSTADTGSGSKRSRADGELGRRRSLFNPVQPSSSGHS